MPPAPKVFSEYASVVRHLAMGGQANRARRVAVLPTAIQHVAQKAEATPEFSRVATALLPGRNSPNYHASEILRRSGFYNATLTSRARNPRWNVISRRIIPHKVAVTSMLLLDLCWFAREQFRIAGYLVRKHSREEIRQLGPGYDVTEAFYKRERLDPEWFSQQWFLEKAHTINKKPGRLTAEWPRDIALDDHWQPLLILGLYSPVCLQVPVIVDNHQNWELAIRRFTHPQVDIIGEEQDEVPYHLYKLQKAEWPAFRKFCRLMESGLKNCQGWGRIRIAARRFLRATFLSTYDGDAWAGDDADDVLLQYVFALEALLNADDRESISEKIAVRTALLTGRTDDERLQTKRLVKVGYSSRSKLAHGKASAGPIDLTRLRDVCRRAIAVSVEIASSCASEKQFADRMEEALVSHSVQKDLQAHGKRIQHLMAN